MDSTALSKQFRSDMRDFAEPFMWTKEEVYLYIDDAQKMFCRLTGGIRDSSSAVAVGSASAGEAFMAISPLVLKIRHMENWSRMPMGLYNLEDMEAGRLDFASTSGPLRGAVLGMDDYKVRLVPIPDADQDVYMTVNRMPLATITGPNQTLEVSEEHHLHLLDWVKRQASLKQDADVFDGQKAKEFGDKFMAYCDLAKAERERREHKYRAVAYGGI